MRVTLLREMARICRRQRLVIAALITTNILAVAILLLGMFGI